MNRHPTLRAGWLKYGLLTALIMCGGAGGLYLSGGWPEGQHPAPVDKDPGGGSDAAAATYTHRYPLTSLDAKDTIEGPALAADSAGRIFLAWGSKTGQAERTVFLTRTIDAGQTFDTPKALSKGGVFRSRSKGKKEGYERRSSPHVAAVGKELHLTWSEAGADGVAMRLLLATSQDAGVTFDAPTPVHQAPEANPTFTALGAGAGGALACAWLGGPAGQQPFAAVRRAGARTFEQERLVHPGQDEQGVCPCCPLAACFAPDGTVYVAFRNLDDGYRDIAVGVLRPGQTKFAGPFPVTPPTWKFNGCPHDGPSLALVGDLLYVAWMDARTGAPRCYFAWANTPAMKFTARELHAAAPGSQGNAKLFADASGALHAVWEESIGAEPAGAHSGHVHGPPKIGAGGGRAIAYAMMSAGQTEFAPPRMVAQKSGAFQTRPAIVATPKGVLYVAWNELDETGKSIVVTRMPGAGPSSGKGTP